MFGRYSLIYFAFIVAYTLGMLAWASLLLRPNDDRWLVKGVGFIQNHALIALAVLAGIALTISLMLIPQMRLHRRLLEYPALQATIMVILLIAAGLILFYNWDNDGAGPQWWRKLAAALLGLIVAVEIIVQLLAFFGLMPSLTSTRDAFAPYTRVYQTEEGFGSGTTNQYGRYTPSFKLLPDSYRIALIGDTFIQGLQVRKNENLGVQLQQALAENGEDDQVKEVLTLGYPDYGPGMYLSAWMLSVIKREFKPDEAIVFFDLGSDFQQVDGPGQGQPYFVYTGQGTAQLKLDAFFIDLHNPEHVVFRGHEGFQLIRALGSQYLTPRFISLLLAEAGLFTPKAEAGQTNDAIELGNDFLFNSEANDKEMRIASAQINMAREQLKRAGTAMKLVTIPAFTEAFYAQSSWNTQFGESDLLVPENELRATARNYGLPFLGLGTFMAAKGLTPAEVQAFYYDQGLGNFTPAGHAFAAEAVYQCFFAKTLTAAEGCDLPSTTE